MALATASAPAQRHHAAETAHNTEQPSPSKARVVCLDIGPHLIHSMLSTELKRWLADDVCQVLLATGLTARQRSTVLQSVVKQHGASLFVDEAQQDDGSMALQIIKAPAAPSLEQNPCGSSRTQTVCLKVSPNRTMSVLKQHLKHWCCNGCEVLVVTGLTSMQRDEAHALIQKSYGPDVIHETVRQDGVKVLRIMKADGCIMAVLQALQSGSLPQELCRQLVDSLRQYWTASELARAERCKQEAELRRLHSLTCDGCCITGDRTRLVVHERTILLLCMECYSRAEDLLEDELGGMPCPGCGGLCNFWGMWHD